MSSKKSPIPPSQFSSRLGFLIAAASCSVGLSNVWRFPAEVGLYGGGAFFVIYLGFVLLLGYPLLLVELAIGRASQGGPCKTYSAHRGWQWLGVLPTVVAFLIYSFYNLVIAWIVAYVWLLLSGQLLLEDDFGRLFAEVQTDVSTNVAAVLFFFLLVGFINQAGVTKGIERVARLLMPLFLLIMVGLILYASQLSGAKEGYSFFLTPKWDNFTYGYSPIFAALGQSFMSLSIGSGQMLTYGAYTSKKEQLKKSAAIIVGADTLIALLAGFIIFPCIFSYNIPHDQGEGLAFVSLPHMFQALGSTKGMIFGTLFFLLLVFAAITSSMSLLEVPTKYLIECFGWSRKRSVWVTSLGAFLISIACILGCAGYPLFCNVIGGFHCMQVLEIISVDIGMPLSACCFSFFVAYQWKTKDLMKEITPDSKQTNTWFMCYVNLTLRCVIPLLIGVTLLYTLWKMIS